MKPYEISLSNMDIEEKRKGVKNKFLETSLNIKSGNINFLTPLDLKILFYIYDEVFFGGELKKNLYNSISFSTSKRMTRSAGLTIAKKSKEGFKFDIRMGENFFLYFEKLQGNKVNGIEAADGLMALCLVLEHEICHVIEFYYFGSSSCKRKRFKSVSNGIFGHTSSYHELLIPAKKAEINPLIKPGMKVCFRYKEVLYYGIIYSINKRAAVMVPNNHGRYMDKEGRRYEKYYVPLEMLKGVE